MSTHQHLDENIKLRLDRATYRKIQTLARKGDRTAAQELRRAIRAYVEVEAAKEKEAAA